MKLFSSSLLQVNTFTYCFSLYFLNAVSQGFKIADQNDQNWGDFLFIVAVCGYRDSRIQVVTKRRRLSWLTDSALVYEPKLGGGGGLSQ